MPKLTIKQLEALSDADDGKTLREDGGIVAKVRAGARGITVQFRFEFKWDSAKRDQRLGTWPKNSLAVIRAERDELKTSNSPTKSPTRSL